MDSGITRCLKTHYRKSLAKLRLLAFDVLKALRLLSQAWNSVETTIQSFFKKITFVRLKAEEEVWGSENNVRRYVDEIWERHQACGLNPEACAFTEYCESDANIVTRRTVTESDILHDLQSAAESELEESDNDDGSDLVEALPTPAEALTSMRQARSIVTKMITKCCIF